MSHSDSGTIHEALRLPALRARDLLDSGPEDIFESLVDTAAALCDAPVAFVSLVDEDREWFKSSVGLPGVREMRQSSVFCRHVVSTGHVLEVGDTSQDARFADHPLVTGPPNIQFYAGAPIRTSDGVTIGSLCVIDHLPRKLFEHQLLALRQLAGVAARGLEARATARRAAHELARGRQLLQVTLDAIVDAVITTDPDGVVQWMNPAAESATGWSAAEGIGRRLSTVFVVFDEVTRTFAPSPVELCLGRAAPVLATERQMLAARDGREFGIDSAASPLRDPAGTLLGAVLTFRDVSEQRRLHSELSHRAMHDVLTGLPNRGTFESVAAQALAASTATGTSHALMYLDLDQFKLVNDACGHAAGDQLLQQIARILRACVRVDDTVARLGGDEFGVLLHHCDVLQAKDIAQKICDHLDDFRFVHDGRRFRVGASIGLVPMDERWGDVIAVLQAADASCYAAKEEGRNRVHTWQDSDTALATRQGEMQWISRLELALDEHRFELHGQRIVPIDVGRSGLHFEVLLRMRETDGTLTFPGVFLPIAERFHLATRIDRWVVHHAFAWMTRAARSGVDVELMSINLSGQTLGDSAFHRDIVQMIRDATFDVGRLCLEITETAAITNLSVTRAFIDDVRSLGVKVALDDFGAGASSFGYLKSLPVDFLKIDGHFITNLLDDAIDNAAVRCFCEVAKIMGIRTIAEFVEKDAVRDELRRIGVDLAQGYLIHVPEPLVRLLPAVAAADPDWLGLEDTGSTTFDRPLTELSFDLVNPNRLDQADRAEVLLWADDLSISVARLLEIVAKVGPMRAAIRFYVDAGRAADRVPAGEHLTRFRTTRKSS